MKIAIIGAGISGLVLAKHLKDNADITLFEKSGGVSGRMSTRYAEDFEFDHGTQFFTARSQMFAKFLEPLIEAGIVESWPAALVDINGAAEVTPRDTTGLMYCGAPRMNTVGRHIIGDYPIVLRTEIDHVFRGHDKWFLKTTAGEELGPYDWVVSTAPAPQTAKILPQEFVSANKINSVVMAGCFSLMLGLSTEARPPWDGAFVHGSKIGWMAINSDKPNRKKALSLVIQSTNEWAETHMEEDKARVQQELIDEAERLLGQTLGNAIYSSLHRWRFANVVEPMGLPYVVDPKIQLAACGDWCIKGRVEAAFESGCNLALAINEFI